MADATVNSAAGGAAVGTAISPGLGTAIGAGVGLLGGMASSAFNAFQQTKQNRFNRDMANTSHQREVADLRKAGLNPLLSLNKGEPVPQQQAPTIDNPVNSALQGAMASSQIRASNADAKMKEVSAQNEATKQYWTIQQLISNAQAAADNADATPFLRNRAKTELENLQKQGRMLEAQLNLLRLNTYSAENEAEFQKSSMGKLNPFLQHYLRPAESAFNASTWFMPR